jgi:hypothetical protein
VALLAVLGSFLCAGPVDAARILTPDGHRARPFQGWSDHAKVPAPRGYITVTDSRCPGRPEPTCSQPGAIWFSEAWAVNATPRRWFLHELGHQFDYVAMTAASRAAFEKITGDSRPWRSPPNSPHEQFAEAYALCALRSRLPRDFAGGGYLYRPTPDQFHQACALIRSVGDRADAEVAVADGHRA